MSDADAELIAQVVPEIPTFAVDDGFSYSIPAGLDLSVGSVVRIPVGNRRKRGYVISVRRGDVTGLKPIAAVSSDYPAFSSSGVEVLRWIATHYVAPMSVVLAKTTPPNLPKKIRLPELEDPARTPSSVHPSFTTAAANRKRTPATAILVRDELPAAIAGLLGPVVRSGRSAMVIAPTVIEADRLGRALEAWFGNRIVITHSRLESKVRTRAWVRTAAQAGNVLVGTREGVLWPVADLGIAIAVEEERPAMKEPQTPTMHVREVLRKRATVEKFALAFVGSTASTDLLDAGVGVVATSTRLWPLVEVIDRSEEPPEGRLLSPSGTRALTHAFNSGKRLFVFAHRRGYAPAFRCVQCRAVRTCSSCEARLGRGPVCERCGYESDACTTCKGVRFEPLGAGVERIAEHVGRVLDIDLSEPGHEKRVSVGSEADLAAATGVDLALIVDADGLIAAPHYRARERSLQVMVRVARLVERGRGNRLIVQTSHPLDPVIVALRRGDASEFMLEQLAERARLVLPPAGEVLVVETSEPTDELSDLAAERGVELFGPAPAGHGFRWLAQGRDLRAFRIGLRDVIHTWRQKGITVRVDADPRDL
ncbi:MAG: hypothetical protein KJO36_01290 [Acidimicrobiia bacterium]|nr:hypothetical protein [Acidimicrobiia bacterium]